MTFNLWLQRGHIPTYLKTARIIPLSKTNAKGCRLDVGDIRTIAILPAFFKLFELCVI